MIASLRVQHRSAHLGHVDRVFQRPYLGDVKCQRIVCCVVRDALFEVCLSSLERFDTFIMIRCGHKSRLSGKDLDLL